MFMQMKISLFQPCCGSLKSIDRLVGVYSLAEAAENKGQIPESAG